MLANNKRSHLHIKICLTPVRIQYMIRRISSNCLATDIWRGMFISLVSQEVITGLNLCIFFHCIGPFFILEKSIAFTVIIFLYQ